ncbi:DUF6452 family protein [Eudoraea chungangensis]|uniref:DUF6452 family protein n=1 Tax=Eudoraea chungangensis TaxID=1481905 RepID=UPI0023EADAF7|nr:DUF6452 family protein [Eudoraea chungangensis]
MSLKRILPVGGFYTLRILISLLSLLSVLLGCEKDDICVDGDTPLLVIQFFDIDNPEESKAVPSLRVVGQNQNITVNTISDRTSLDSIGIPLRINEADTSFIFISDSEDNEEDQEIGNVDNLSFQYNTREVFISRACGYVANYNDLSDNLIPDADNWIREIEIVSPIVENQTITHVKIYH